jgi:DNA topoisomerase-1
VNDYLREITGEEFTAKDFRTWHGTGHMAQLLSALGPGGSKTHRKRNIVEAVKETAKHLGNRPAACRKYYIHPAVLEGYEEQTLFAAMRTRSKQDSAAMAGLRAFEIATLRLVQSYYPSRERRRKAS